MKALICLLVAVVVTVAAVAADVATTKPAVHEGACAVTTAPAASAPAAKAVKVAK